MSPYNILYAKKHDVFYTKNFKEFLIVVAPSVDGETLGVFFSDESNILDSRNVLLRKNILIKGHGYLEEMILKSFINQKLSKADLTKALFEENIFDVTYMIDYIVKKGDLNSLN